MIDEDVLKQVQYRQRVDSGDVLCVKLRGDLIEITREEEKAFGLREHQSINYCIYNALIEYRNEKHNEEEKECKTTNSE